MKQGKRLDEAVRDALRPIDGSVQFHHLYESDSDRITEYLLYMNYFNWFVERADDHFMVVRYTEEALERLIVAINNGEEFRDIVIGADADGPVCIDLSWKFENYSRCFDNSLRIASEKVRVHYQAMIDSAQIKNYITIVACVGQKGQRRIRIGVRSYIPSYFVNYQQLIQWCRAPSCRSTQLARLMNLYTMLPPNVDIGTTGRSLIKLMLPMKHRCVACNRPATKKCLSCRLSYYCTRECQERNWSEHQELCFVNRVLAAIIHLKL